MLINCFKYFLLFTFLFSFTLSAQQNLEKQYQLAESLFEKEKYFEAVTEYKRLLFFDQDRIYSYQANYKIGEAYKKGGFFENSVKYFTKAAIETESFEERADAEFQVIRVNILRKTTSRAIELLDDMLAKKEYNLQVDEINYWKGWAYMLSDNWEKASESFALISGDHELKLLCDSVAQNKYSVTFAEVISYILPGSGQFYTGNYFSAVMSLGWNVLFGYLTLNAFIEERAFDGIAIGSLLWLRFYRGNIQNARKLAEEKNLEITNEVLIYLQNNYQGIKP